MINKKSFTVVLVFLLLGILTRFLPLPPNFSPISAAALFGGAYISNKRLKYFIPLVILWISDIVLNNTINSEFVDGFTIFYVGSGFTYFAFTLIIFVGAKLTSVKPAQILLGSLASAIIFFIVSNFGVWASTNMYAKSFTGLLNCYIMAVPFFKHTLISSILFSALFFGIFEFLVSKKLIGQKSA